MVSLGGIPQPDRPLLSFRRPHYCAGGGVGVRGGAVCHIRAISTGVRLHSVFRIPHSTFRTHHALQGQGFGGEGAGGFYRAGVFVAQRVFLDSAFCILPSSFALLLGFSIPCSTRSQSSNVRWVCRWREVISIRRRSRAGSWLSARSAASIIRTCSSEGCSSTDAQSGRWSARFPDFTRVRKRRRYRRGSRSQRQRSSGLVV